MTMLLMLLFFADYHLFVNYCPHLCHHCYTMSNSYCEVLDGFGGDFRIEEEADPEVVHCHQIRCFQML